MSSLQTGYINATCNAQGDLTRRFVRRALQLAVLCASLVTVRSLLLWLLAAGEHQSRSRAAVDLLPVKRPARWTEDPPSSGPRVSAGASAAASTPQLPLLSHALHARTWPAAGAILDPPARHQGVLLTAIACADVL